MISHYIRKNYSTYFTGFAFKKVVCSYLSHCDEPGAVLLLDVKTGSDVDMFRDITLYEKLLSRHKIKKHTEINKWEI